MLVSNIKNLLQEAGIEDIRPTEKALEKMDLSRRRFTQLVQNVNKRPITVAELENIKNWMSNWKNIDTNELLQTLETAGSTA